MGRLLLVVGVAALSLGCLDDLGPKACTLIGCLDEATLTFETEEGSWAPGRYGVAVSFDGTTRTCEARLPDELPLTGSVASIPCSPNGSLTITQDAQCTTMENRQSCTPLDNSWSLELSLSEAPRAVSVRVTRDGEVLLEQTSDIEYRTYRPNGPECGPVCRSGSLRVDVPARSATGN